MKGRSSRSKCCVWRILELGLATGWEEGEGREGLISLQERLEEAEAEAAVKATTMATRNKNKFKIPAEIRKLATEAARGRNPILRKELRKQPGKPGET